MGSAARRRRGGDLPPDRLHPLRARSRGEPGRALALARRGGDGLSLPSVTFLPSGARVPCAAGESVFGVARRSGVTVTTACVGKATCGLCRVKVVGGEQHLS